jgi:prevent-host-death family protein
MTSIGISDAKKQLSRLLERVNRGERILITKHGRPAALLAPAERREPRKIAKTFGRCKSGKSSKGRPWDRV